MTIVFRSRKKRTVNDFPVADGTQIDRVIRRLEVVADRMEAAYETAAPLIHQKIQQNEEEGAGDDA